MAAISPSIESKNPAIDLARSLVSGEIVKGTWRDTGILPSLWKLAKAAGVSRITMWKAVRLLAQKGMVTIIPRGKILIGNRQPSTPTPEVPRLWSKTLAKMTEDISNGRYNHLPRFPSLKELCLRYDVSYQTMRRAIASLISAGILVRQGKRLSMPVARRRSRQSTIVVFSSGFRTMGPGGIDRSLAEERMKEVTRILESECASTGFSVHFVDLTPGRAMVNRKAIQEFSDRDTIAGYAVNFWTGGIREWKEEMFDHIRSIIRAGLPTAIFDHEVQFSGVLHADAHSQIRIFRDGSHQAGIQTAKMLLGKGHCCIAYFGLWHHYQWSVERLEGLCEVYQHAGILNGVTPFTSERESLASLPSFLERALQVREITAWVCSSDSIGLAALSYLTKKRVMVPQGMAVTSFDNTLLSFEKKLTSVDLNMPLAAYRILPFILSPRTKQAGPDPAPVIIEPTLIERASTQRKIP